MSPLPYVRGQVVVLALLLTGCLILGAAALVLVLAGAGLGWLLAMRRKYRRDKRVAKTSTPKHRARLDRVVWADGWFAIGPPAAAAMLLLVFGAGALVDQATARGVVSALAIAAAGVYLSSLVDWYVILPRISGQLGVRPCRKNANEFRTFPKTWKEVTRWWYIHRVVAALVFRFALAAAIAVALGSLIGTGVVTNRLVALAVGLFGAYEVAVPWAIKEAGQAKLIIGQTVTVKTKAKPWFLPPFGQPYPPVLRDRRYVYDIALEGVQLVRAAPREKVDLANPPEFAKHPDRISLSQLESAELARRQFAGCEGRCSGINWYCIENSRCFEPK